MRPWGRLGRTGRLAALVVLVVLALADLAAAQKGGLAFGALLPLTGPLADRGKTSKVALELAQADINAYLAASGASGQMSISVENTGGDPTQAVEKLKALAGRGIKVFIGPFSDAEAEACLDYADKNNLLLVSQGSSGPFLSKKGDNLFRLSPSDTYQAEAVTSLIRQEGVATIVPLWRADRYGDDLVVHVKARFKQLGGEAMRASATARSRSWLSPVPGMRRVASAARAVPGKARVSKRIAVPIRAVCHSGGPVRVIPPPKTPSGCVCSGLTSRPLAPPGGFAFGPGGGLGGFAALHQAEVHGQPAHA